MTPKELVRLRERATYKDRRKDNDLEARAGCPVCGKDFL